MTEAGAAGEAAPGPSWVGPLLNGDGSWSLRRKVPYLLGLLMLFDSWDSIVIAFTLPSIASEWHLGLMQRGWLISSGYAGQLIGAILFGSVAEARGRLPVLRPLTIAMCLLAVASAFAGNYTQLIALRLLQGLTIGGGLPVAICYINEIAPAATRGRFFGTYQFLMLSGYGIASLASIFIVPAYGWSAIFLLGALPLLLVPLLYILPESPRWLAGRGRAQEALRAIARLGGNPASTAAAIPAGADGQVTPRQPLSALLTGGRLRTTIVVSLLWFLTSLVTFGLVNWVPSIYASVFGFPLARALRYSAIASVVIFFLPLVLRAVIDRIGRRLPSTLGTALGGLSLLALTVVDRHAEHLLVPLIILGQIGVSIGSMVLWPFTAEVYDTRVRALALGMSSSLARAASMLTPLVVGGLLAATGSIVPVFLVFGLCAITVAALWWRATRETAGRDIDG